VSFGWWHTQCFACAWRLNYNALSTERGSTGNYHSKTLDYVSYSAQLIPLVSYKWFCSITNYYTLRAYKVAITELYLVQISGLWVHMALLNTTLLFQLHRRSLLWSHCCWTELIHKAATVTFNNPHNARAINTRCRLMKTKRKRRKIPSSAQSAHIKKRNLNPLAPELFFFILAHPVYNMWIIQEPNKLALWNKLHFEEEKTESIEHV